MIKNRGFEFKQFYVAHDKCAMKVGTDGVLLGAWANLNKVEQVLDVGCGSGLISLMVAQRLSEYHLAQQYEQQEQYQQPRFQVEGIDIDEQAVEQSSVNFSNSPWKERLSASFTSLNQSGKLEDRSFDLVISNPPYFLESLQATGQQRQQARHLSLDTEINNHLQWLEYCANLITKSGRIALVLPYAEGKNLLAQIQSQENGIGLSCIRYCEVITKEGKPPLRVLLEFALSHLKQPCENMEDIVIYDKNNQYTDRFKTLTKEFYLNF